MVPKCLARVILSPFGYCKLNKCVQISVIHKYSTVLITVLAAIKLKCRYLLFDKLQLKIVNVCTFSCTE